MTPSAGIAIAARFPFGRYAATPWFRSRREHVGNVEWPPSPWRIARALIASAHSLGDEALVDDTTALVGRMATVAPQYVLPPTTEIVYAQWMPQLAFDDSPGASARGEYGHTLLALSPSKRLVALWPELDLSPAERDLLMRLLSGIFHLGQSVAVCALELVDPSAELAGELRAIPLAAQTSKLEADGHRVRLLAPIPTVTRPELEVATSAAWLKAAPALPGSVWLDYEVKGGEPSATPRAGPLMVGIVYRLEGELRPTEFQRRHPVHGGSDFSRRLRGLLARSLRTKMDDVAECLLDDDGDGRFDRLELRFPEPVSARRALLLPDRLEASWFAGGGLDCELRVERIDWKGSAAAMASTVAEGPRTHLIALTLNSSRRPLLTDAITVAEVFRRRLLGVAARRFGAERLPSRLTGRSTSGEVRVDQHRHAHYLPASAGDGEIDTLAIWSPEGFDTQEVEALLATALPTICGAVIHLRRSETSPIVGPSRLWRSHTPFLPVKYPKRRGGAWTNTPEQQVVTELALRGFPQPTRAEPLPGPWSAFRIIRREKSGSVPSLGRHGFRIEFPEPVEGPIALGRNSHFGMGLFLPERPDG